jgi:hypothetical protein
MRSCAVKAEDTVANTGMGLRSTVTGGRARQGGSNKSLNINSSNTNMSVSNKHRNPSAVSSIGFTWLSRGDDAEVDEVLDEIDDELERSGHALHHHHHHHQEQRYQQPQNYLVPSGETMTGPSDGSHDALDGTRRFPGRPCMSTGNVVSFEGVGGLS